MSLILDALKRAERDRRLEKAPDLTAVYDEDHLSRRRIKPWAWVGGLSLIAAVVLVFILWPDHPPAGRSPVPGKASVARSTPSKVWQGKEKKVLSAPFGASIQGRVKDSAARDHPPETAARSKPVATAPAETAPARPVIPATPPRLTPVDAVKSAGKGPPTGLPQPAEKVSAPPVPTDLTAAKTGDVPTPAAPGPGQEASSPPTPAPVKEVPLNPPVPLAQPEAAPSPPPPPEPATQADSGKKPAIPLLSELPFEVKEKLGDLKINVHSYAEDAAERLIFINMKSVKVGDHIGENGPVLKEITPEGAIIDYGGGLVRLQVWR